MKTYLWKSFPYFWYGEKPWKLSINC